MEKRVLVIDDDEGILDAFRAILESNAYIVETSVTADALLPRIKKFRPHIIMLDVLLSGRDGREVCKQLKMQKETKRIPVIMMSAHPSAIKAPQDVGADAFLAKPFEMDELLATVKKHLQSA